MDYGTIGPLRIMLVLGSELIPGDVITINDRMKVVLRSYSLEHIRKQACDVEDGRKDEHGDFVGPYRTLIDMDEKFCILRARSK